MVAPEEGSVSEGNVTVVVRVRPPNQREQEGNQQTVVQVVDRSMLVFDPEESDPNSVFVGLRNHDAPKRKCKDLKFMFDHVFGEDSRQQEVFQHTTRDILDGVLNGYNCSVFAYGATGAGKTHTMLGSEVDPGVMFLTMVELYRRIEEIKEEKLCEVLISYLEVYNEQIQDLLEPKGFLAIREDSQKGVVVQGLSLHQPKSAEQLLQMLANGNKNRTQHPTDANATSSRSHAVFQIYVKQQDRAAGINRDLRVAKMSLIDLAGSERASTTNAKGDRQREGANINRSLLALINVINALADAKSKKLHIPYRDSKLTRLLKDSIGGNCRTVMIAAVSPSFLSYDDTYNTLKYANRAKEIKLSMKSNVISLDCHISKYAAVCEELKAEVAELRQRLSSYEHVGTDSQEERSIQSDSSLQEGERCRLEEPPQETKSDQEAVCETLEQAGSRVREFNARTSARRRGHQHDNFSPEEKIKQDPQPNSEYRRRLRPRNASQRRKDLLEGQVTEHETQYIDRMERLVIALLRLVRTQQSALVAADLQTPEMKAEFEELEKLVCREKGAMWGVAAAGQHTKQTPPLLQQPPTKRKLRLQQPTRKRRRSLVQSVKKDEEDSLTMAVETVPLISTHLPLDRVELQNTKEEDLDPKAQMRPLLKRCRRELLPDCSPTLDSPVVPVKKRRKCAASPPAKEGIGVPSSDRHPKSQKKRLLPGLSRESLESVTTAPSLSPASGSGTPDILADSPLQPMPIGTPSQTTSGLSKCCPSTVTKGRLPLATSAIQNCATLPRAPLPARDLNSTFDIAEEGWPSSVLDKTVILGPSSFSGWENIGCGFRQGSVSSVSRHEVAVFTMKGPPVSRSSAPQPPSTVKKPSAQRRRRVSISTSKSMGGPYSQSRIARLSSTVKKPSTIAEHKSASPRWQTEKKTKKAVVAFGRTIPVVPASRSLQFASAKS
ncbi:kinesin-like protein KIF18B isoform X2 [Ambystoma mexicanum]